MSYVLPVGGAQGIAAAFNEKEVVLLNNAEDLVEIYGVAQGMGDEVGASWGGNRRGDLVSQFGFGHDLLDFQSSILIIFLVTYSSVPAVRMHTLFSRDDQ
jgi:hypothetical protein